MGTRKKALALVDSLRGGRWTAKDARTVLRLQVASGNSITVFARDHGLSAPRMFWWRRRLADSAPTQDAVQLAPVVVTGGKAAAVVIRMNAVELEVHDPASIDPKWVAEIISAIGAR